MVRASYIKGMPINAIDQRVAMQQAAQQRLNDQQMARAAQGERLQAEQQAQAASVQRQEEARAAAEQARSHQEGMARRVDTTA